MTLLGAAVGLAVWAAAAGAGGTCGTAEVGPGSPPGDPLCEQLVRTLAERMGLMAAAATVLLALTVVGLSRLSRSS